MNLLYILKSKSDWTTEPSKINIESLTSLEIQFESKVFSNGVIINTEECEWKWQKSDKQLL